MWLPPFQGPDRLNLAETKTQLRVHHYDVGAHIEALVDTATASVADCLDLAVESLPAPVCAAILLRVDDPYENREARSEGPLTANPTFTQLLDSYPAMML